MLLFTLSLLILSLTALLVCAVGRHQENELRYIVNSHKELPPISALAVVEERSKVFDESIKGLYQVPVNTYKKTTNALNTMVRNYVINEEFIPNED